jgi:EAL domain-containing protein (putative c-di-GMP-specific phosphodiesterase class I)
VRLSLDDFGTGYSSLSYLRKFPFHKIKLDRSFVADLGRDTGSAAIVRAVASLGSELGMTILVEGIETQEQLERVKAEGCTEGQGFLFGRPVPAAEIRAILAGGTAVRRLVA